MKILAIETSCDDTCIAIIEVKELQKKTSFTILSNVVHTQLIHNQYGGVFPAMAKREHIKNINSVYEHAMNEAKNPNIDIIAVTVGPGLEPALWVGITFAEELAKKWSIPIIPVNHMEGHILSIFPNKTNRFSIDKNKKIFPLLSLLVSGGHTEIILIKKWQEYTLIGQTRDDAAGEAFDKVARMLGLPYPGGPEISRLAQAERKNSAVRSLESTVARARGIFQQKNTRGSQSTISSEVTLPRPMIHSKDYDFSFSGLKTAVLYYIRDHGPLTEKMKSEIAREFEDAAIEVLVSKTVRALQEFKTKTLIIGGGVSANSYLQKVFKKAIKKLDPKVIIHFPTQKLTGDNALMIAIAGYFKYKNKKYSKNPDNIVANGNLSL